LFPESHSRGEVIVTFLALLELVKLKLVTVMQREEFEEIWLRLAVEGDAAGSSQPA
jgi:segregation and condensation protein A